jgi:hypothetical protein
VIRAKCYKFQKMLKNGKIAMLAEQQKMLFVD